MDLVSDIIVYICGFITFACCAYVWSMNSRIPFVPVIKVIMVGPAIIAAIFMVMRASGYGS